MLYRLFAYSFPARARTPERGDPSKVVVLHSLHRVAPSVLPVSPFVGKLLTFCRLNPSIPLKIVQADFQRTPKGKVPFIEHDGKVIGDSQLIIGYLTRTFLESRASRDMQPPAPGELDLRFVPWHELAPQQQAMSTVITRTIEEHLYWALLYYRWVRTEDGNANWSKTVEVNFAKVPVVLRVFMVALFRQWAKTSAWAHGLVRHHDADIAELVERDIDALAMLLADKPFFTGSRPTECDCTAFAALDQAVSTVWTTPFAAMIARHGNLMNFVERMRTSLFAEFVDSAKKQHWHTHEKAK